MPYTIGKESLERSWWVITRIPFEEGSQLIYAIIEAISESFPQAILQLYSMYEYDVDPEICITSIAIATLAIGKHSIFFFLNKDSLSLARQHFGHDDAVQQVAKVERKIGGQLSCFTISASDK